MGDSINKANSSQWKNYIHSLAIQFKCTGKEMYSGLQKN